ncbi:MAG TPA: Hpt domain-containing protein [Candidatus Sulfotelmatobacter sp.]|nr:Hpt domain-containing protein [Candidatus Sulfotelmatobacter sp.]
MDDIIKDFLIESNENLDRLDQELVRLESNPTSRELLDGIFRTIHTIKGSCGFLGFSRLEKVAHAGENLLSKLREGQLTLNSEITSGLLAMVDAVRRMLSEIQAAEQDGDNDYPELLAQLKALQEPNQQQEASVAPPAEPIESPVDNAPSIQSYSPAESDAEVSEVSPASEAVTEPDRPIPESTGQFTPSPSKIGGLLVNRGSIRAND